MAYEPQIAGLLDVDGRIRITDPMTELGMMADMQRTPSKLLQAVAESSAVERATIKAKYAELGMREPTLEGGGIPTAQKLAKMLTQSQPFAKMASKLPVLTGVPPQPGAGVRPPQKAFHFN